MIQGATDDPRVVIEDVGVDAVLHVEDGEQPLLVLRPGQTFTSACDAVSRAVPQMHPDAVRRLVRRHLPEASDFALLGIHPADDPVSRALPIAPKVSRRTLTALVVAAVLGFVAVSGVLVSVLTRPDMQAGSSTQDAGEWADLQARATLPFHTPLFLYLKTQLWHCHDDSLLTATCTDAQNRIVAVDASIGPDFTGFTFTGSDGGGTAFLRVYSSESHASLFAAARNQAGDAHMVAVGPYAITGEGAMLDTTHSLISQWVRFQATHSK